MSFEVDADSGKFGFEKVYCGFQLPDGALVGFLHALISVPFGICFKFYEEKFAVVEKRTVCDTSRATVYQFIIYGYKVQIITFRIVGYEAFYLHFGN